MISRSKEYQREWARNWRLKNPELAKEKDKKTNKLRAPYKRKYQKDRKDQLYKASLQRQYNISIERYNEMLVNQGNVCAICLKPETRLVNGKTTNLTIDHDHDCCNGARSCGKCIRSLLCHACNVSVGLMQECPDRLRRAADYIELFNRTLDRGKK